MRKFISYGVVKDFITRRFIFLSGTPLEYLLIGLLFFLLTLFYTDFVLLHGTHQLFIEGPGDGTAGFLWLNFADTDWRPLFGHTDMVNYPTGENLNSPTFITYSALLAPLWLLSRLFGTVMALNTVTFFGFFGGAMVTYWLMKRLTNNVMVSIFAGFALAFVPYNIMKSSSHLAYIFNLVFVLIFAAFIGLWRRPSVIRAIIFASAIALAFYTDGYYLLIGSVFVVCLIAGAFIYLVLSRMNIKTLMHKVKFFTLAGLVLLILMTPIALVQITQGGQIKNSLGNVRADISFEIQYYSARMMDFIIPSPHDPIFINNPDFQQIEKYKNSRSNSSENTLYIGFTLICLCIVGLCLVVWYALRKQGSSLQVLSKEQRGKFTFVGVLSVVSIPLLFVWMLPPHMPLFGHNVPMPSSILIDHNIALWRVMSRFFIPFHVIIVIFAAYSLYVGMEVGRLSKRKYIPLVLPLALIGVLAVEYASLTSRPPYDFNNTPVAYSWLKQQKDIQVVSELPLVDRPLEVSYNFVTAQIVHGKKLINTHLSNNVIGGRTALGDVDDGEAVDYSIARGAQAIITHNIPCGSVSWGWLAYEDKNTSKDKVAQNYGSPICIYKVRQGSHIDREFVTLASGTFADAPLISKDNKKEYSLIYGGRGQLVVKNELNQPVSGMSELSAHIQSSPNAPSLTGTWEASQHGRVVARGHMNEDINILIDANIPIDVTVRDSDGHDPQLYQVALSDIKVTAQ